MKVMERKTNLETNVVDTTVADKTVQTTGSGEGSGGTAVPKFPDFSKLTRVQAVLDTNKYVHTTNISLKNVPWQRVGDMMAEVGKPGPGDISPRRFVSRWWRWFGAGCPSRRLTACLLCACHASSITCLPPHTITQADFAPYQIEPRLAASRGPREELYSVVRGEREYRERPASLSRYRAGLYQLHGGQREQVGWEADVIKAGNNDFVGFISFGQFSCTLDTNHGAHA